MPRPRSRELAVEILPPSDGLNIAVDENQLGDREAIHISGWEMDEVGSLSVPFGDHDLGVLPGTTSCLNAHIYTRTFTDDPQLIVHLSDGSVRYSTDFRTAATATWTTIVTGMSTTHAYTFLTAFGFVWMTNGINDLRRWDGAATTTYAAAPKGTAISQWKDTLWITGVIGGGNEDRVYQSAPGDGTTWPALNFVDVGKGVGSPNTWLEPTDATLVVFKAHQVWGIYDPVEYTNRLVDAGKGCISREAACNYHGQIYYLSEFGLARYFDDGPGDIVSAKVAPIFDPYRSPTDIAPNSGHIIAARLYTWTNYVAVFMPNFFVTFLYYPDLPNKPFVWGEYPNSGRWGIYLPAFVTSAQLFVFDTITPFHVFRRYATDATTPVNAVWWTKWYDFDDPFNEKLIYEINVIARGLIEVAVERDYRSSGAAGTPPTVLGTTVESDLWEETTMHVETYGRTFRFRISCTASNETKFQAVQHFQPAASLSPGLRFMNQGGVSKIRIRGRRIGTEMKSSSMSVGGGE